MFNKIQKRLLTVKVAKGKIRHFPPAIREWKDSIYSYNKNMAKDTAIKDELLYETMWSHFLTKRRNKNDRRSNRMLGLLARSKSKRTFLSKPYIKQNTDKNIITFYVFDRENQLLRKRVFYLKKLMRNNNIVNHSLFNKEWYDSLLNQHTYVSAQNSIIKNITIFNLNKQIAELNNYKSHIESLDKNNTYNYEENKNEKKEKLQLIMYKINILTKKVNFLKDNKEPYKSKEVNPLAKSQYIVKRKNKDKNKNRNYTDNNLLGKISRKTRLNFRQKRYQKYLLRKQIKKTKINYNMLPKVIMPSLLNKGTILKNLFLFSFLKWILKQLFSICVSFSVACPYCKKSIKGLSKDKIGRCNKCNKKIADKKIRFTIYKNREILFSVKKKKFNINDINCINIILSRYLNLYINCFKYNNNSILNILWYDKYKAIESYTFNMKLLYKITKLFNLYKSLNYKRFMYKLLFKQLKMIKTLSILQINRLKYTDFLPVVKNFISTIYSKNTELNLVSLKYLHLDSDMFLDSLAIKLNRRKSRVLRIIRKSLKLVKRPKQFWSLLEDKDPLKIEGALHNKENYKKIHSIFDSYNNISNISNYDTKTNILNNLKYKWIAGIRLEAKGRLTKRYTASRALFKYFNRGNLKNLDHLYIRSYEVEPLTVHRVRNQFKPNLQFTYKYGKKMIGTFGLKGWINSV